MNVKRHRVWLIWLAIALALVAGLGNVVFAQGPGDDVPFKEAEQIRVPLQAEGASKAEAQAETDCYPCVYWVTGLRIQKLNMDRYLPLAGWQFTVYNSANQQVAQGVTGANGYVDFFNLPPGYYRVVETPQVNWQMIYPPSGEVVLPVYGGYVTFFRFYNRQGGIVPPGTVTPGTVTPTPTATAPSPPQVGSLKVCKLDVTNAQNPQPVAGWPFRIVRQGGVPSGTYSTSGPQGGCETIIQLPIGNYTVEEILQPGWEFHRVVPDTNGGGNLSTVVPVVSGQTTLVTFENRRAGAQGAGSIKVCKLDVSSGSERAVSGWPMAIQAQPASGSYRTSYTGQDGCVTFTGLTPGSYAIEEGRVAGWEFVSVNPDDGVDPGYRTTVAIAGGETKTVTFRNRRLVPGSIRVCKLDATTTNEQLVNGWLMRLRRPDNTLLATGYTGTFYSGRGCVTFGNLTPGTYIVEEAEYAGWRLDSIDPDDPNHGDLRTTIVVGNGENKTVTFRNKRVP